MPTRQTVASRHDACMMHDAGLGEAASHTRRSLTPQSGCRTGRVKDCSQAQGRMNNSQLDNFLFFDPMLCTKIMVREKGGNHLYHKFVSSQIHVST